MEGYHNLTPDIWDKICTDWLTKCCEFYIVSIWYKFIHFSLPVNPPIHRMVNLPNTLCPRSRDQHESHCYFIFHCKLSKTTLDFISRVINLNYTFNASLKLSPKPKPS